MNGKGPSEATGTHILFIYFIHLFIHYMDKQKGTEATNWNWIVNQYIAWCGWYYMKTDVGQAQLVNRVLLNLIVQGDGSCGFFYILIE